MWRFPEIVINFFSLKFENIKKTVSRNPDLFYSFRNLKKVNANIRN